MNITTTDIVLVTLAAIYGGRVLFFIIGFRREVSRWSTEEHIPSVSIIVPARDEAANIERCIDSLASLDYPRDKLEIIVVDDRSSDGTREILDRLSEHHDALIVLHRTESEVDPNLRGKPGALQHGIEHSHGDIILMTDADCIVEPTWVRGMAAQFIDPKVGLVAGMTSVSGEGFLDRVQDVEWTYTQSMACGSVGNGTPLGCFGNNLAVRRDVFNELGGYKEISFSVTEDLALQDAVSRAGYRTRHAVHRLTSVTTLPAANITEYIRQRHRWVRGGAALGVRAFWFVGSSLSLWIGITVSLVTGSHLWLVAFLALRFLGDGHLIADAARTINRRRIIPMIFPAMILLLSTELVLPLLLLKKRVTWKGQTFRA